MARKYNAAQGGHAPEEIRGRFCELVDIVLADDDVGADSEVEIDGERHNVRDIIGAVWNCTDVLPGMAYRDIRDMAQTYFEEPPKRQTYAAAARVLKVVMARNKAKAKR
jgi:hypothetical protein